MCKKDRLMDGWIDGKRSEFVSGKMWIPAENVEGLNMML